MSFNRSSLVSKAAPSLVVLLFLSLLSGCREKEEKRKEDKQEVEAKREALRLKIEKQKRDARALLDNAKAAAEQLKLQEAFDMLTEAEKLDQSLELEAKLYVNGLGERLVKHCKEKLENDGPDIAGRYLNNPNTDPIIVTKYLLNFITSNDRFKQITQDDAEEVKAYRKRVKYARELYLEAENLVARYKRTEGVARLKELSMKYRDTKWGLAAGDALISLGEAQQD
jgi:hypothetical protein